MEEITLQSMVDLTQFFKEFQTKAEIYFSENEAIPPVNYIISSYSHKSTRGPVPEIWCSLYMTLCRNWPIKIGILDSYGTFLICSLVCLVYNIWD